MGRVRTYSSHDRFSAHQLTNRDDWGNACLWKRCPEILAEVVSVFEANRHPD